MTYVRFKTKDDGLISKVIKQKIIVSNPVFKLKIDGIPYILQDIYGFADGAATDSANNGKIF